MKNGLILNVLICRDDTASIKAASSKIDVTKVLRRRNRIIWEQRNENNNVVGIYNRKLIKHKGIFHSFISRRRFVLILIFPNWGATCKNCEICFAVLWKAGVVWKNISKGFVLPTWTFLVQQGLGSSSWMMSQWHQSRS